MNKEYRFYCYDILKQSQCLNQKLVSGVFKARSQHTQKKMTVKCAVSTTHIHSEWLIQYIYGLLVTNPLIKYITIEKNQ